MKNKYKIDGQTLIVYNRKDNKEMLFDAEDFDLINSYGCWRTDNLGYVKTTGKEINGKWPTIRAHRLIVNCPEDKVVDHINGNPEDNRKLNLRIVSQKENMHNQKDRKGYTWHKAANKWQAQIGLNGKVKSIGLFTTEAEARVAYLEAKKKYHPTAPIKGY